MLLPVVRPVSSTVITRNAQTIRTGNTSARG
jgi:hypothetical protein